MKVYALREMTIVQTYMPIRGYHSSLALAKKQAKEQIPRAVGWDIVTYEVAPKFTKDEIIALLNGDSVTGSIEGLVISDFMTFHEIVFENPVIKQYRKKEKSK